MKILKNYGNFDQLFNEFKLKLNCFFVFDWLCSRCLVQNNSNKNLLKVQIIGLIKQF